MTTKPKPAARKRKPKAKTAPVVEPTETPEPIEPEAPAPVETPEPHPGPETHETPEPAGEEKARSVLDKMHEEIRARMEELRPLVEEYELLSNAEKALGGHALQRPPGKPKPRTLI